MSRTFLSATDWEIVLLAVNVFPQTHLPQADQICSFLRRMNRLWIMIDVPFLCVDMPAAQTKAWATGKAEGVRQEG